MRSQYLEWFVLHTNKTILLILINYPNKKIECWITKRIISRFRGSQFFDSKEARISLIMLYFSGFSQIEASKWRFWNDQGI